MHITLHWGRDQVAVILQAIFSNAVSDKNMRILIDISLKCVFNCPVNTKSTLVQIMAWCQTEDRPLSEPMKSSLPVRCADVASCITMDNAWRVDRLKHRQCSLIPCQGLWNRFLTSRCIYPSAWSSCDWSRSSMPLVSRLLVLGYILGDHSTDGPNLSCYSALSHSLTTLIGVGEPRRYHSGIKSCE